MGQFEGHAVACFRGGRMVFQNLNFALAPGGAALVLGPNGSGKSSLLRLLAGLLKPAAGRLTYDGDDVAKDPDLHHRRIAYLGHLNAIKAVLSVRENIATWLPGGEGSVSLVDAALTRFGLLPLAEQPARLLSAGQRRRLALARLAARGGEIWLLDEPSVGLDQASQKSLEEAIAEHRAGGGLVFLASHTAIDLPDAVELNLADHRPERLPELIW